MNVLYRWLLLFIFVYSVRGVPGFGGVETRDKTCFSHCDVRLPTEYHNDLWTWLDFPGFCKVDTITPRRMVLPDPKCVSSGDTCSLVKKAIKESQRQMYLSYYCSVYNSTTATFFYYGRISGEYVSCS